MGRGPGTGRPYTGRQVRDNAARGRKIAVKLWVYDNQATTFRCAVKVIPKR